MHLNGDMWLELPVYPGLGTPLFKMAGSAPVP